MFQVSIFSNNFDDLSCWFTLISFILSLISFRQAIDHNLLLGCVFARFVGRSGRHCVQGWHQNKNKNESVNFLSQLTSLVKTFPCTVHQNLAKRLYQKYWFWDLYLTHGFPVIYPLLKELNLGLYVWQHLPRNHLRVAGGLPYLLRHLTVALSPDLTVTLCPGSTAPLRCSILGLCGATVIQYKYLNSCRRLFHFSG